MVWIQKLIIILISAIIATDINTMDKFLHYKVDNTIADRLLFDCCQELGIDTNNPEIIYNRIYDIVEVLENYNKVHTIYTILIDLFSIQVGME